MSSESTPFEGGGILPPSSEDYRQMWEQQASQLKPNEYKRQEEANKIAARKQILKEQVAKAVAVRDARLTEVFHANIDIEERR